jgi:hypothetical protein
VAITAVTTDPERHSWAGEIAPLGLIAATGRRALRILATIRLHGS